MVNDLEDVMMQHGVVVRELQAADAEEGASPWVVTCYRKERGVYPFPVWRTGDQSLWPSLAACIRRVAGHRRDGSIAAYLKRSGLSGCDSELMVADYESEQADSAAFYELFSPVEWVLVVKAAETFG